MIPNKLLKTYCAKALLNPWFTPKIDGPSIAELNRTGLAIIKPQCQLGAAIFSPSTRFADCSFANVLIFERLKAIEYSALRQLVELVRTAGY
jgi:hypothetical protein